MVCRSEREQKVVKKTLQANVPQGAEVLRDGIHQIRVDGVQRGAVLDEGGRDLPGVIEAFSKGNNIEITKIT